MGEDLEPVLQPDRVDPVMTVKYPMKAILCPFCGMATDVPHESQDGCIAALQAEIARTRQILQNVTEPLRAPAIASDDEARHT